MLSWFARTTALASAAIAFAQPAPAAAQGLPSFCNGALALNAAYLGIRSNGRTAEVDYRAQFQNRDPQRRAMTVSMAGIERVGEFRVIRPLGIFTLLTHEQRDQVLLTIAVNNPSGQGAPGAVELARQLRFTCVFQ